LKKFLKFVASLIFLVVIIAVLFFVVENIYIGMAENSFNNKDYETAAYRYSVIVNLNPDNDIYKARWADTLMHVPLDFYHQQMICDFMEKYKGESFAYALEQRLAKFKSDLDWKIGTNYIDKAPMNNLILHWEDDAFPLKVYIPNINSDYGNAIKKAYDYWTYATSNFISFTYVDRESDADVVNRLNEKAVTNCSSSGECHYVVAYTAPTIDNQGLLKKMTINFNEKDPYGHDYTTDQMYKTALHEIGHVLGIMGHSDNTENLMYASGQDDTEFNRYQYALTREDLNTLNYLYMIVPHVSNKPPLKRNVENKIYPGIILGTTKEMKERDIVNAKLYIAKAPNLAIGYIDLGNAYLQSDMYNEALQAYYTGYQLSVDVDEKYLLTYNMALTYKKMGNRDKALEFAEHAKKIKHTNEIRNLIHDIKYPWSISGPTSY